MAARCIKVVGVVFLLTVFQMNTYEDNPAMFAWKPMRRQDFRCPLCEKKFVNKSNLNIHVRDKHGEGSGPQVCFICFKQVKNQSCLRVHMYYKHRSNLSPSSLPHNESKI